MGMSLKWRDALRLLVVCEREEMEEKLGKLLEEKGRGAASQLAEYLEVPRNYITRWVKDEKYNFPYEYVNEIAKFFNVAPSYFLEEDDKIPLTHYLPVIGEASCGVPTNHFYYQDYDKIPVPAELYREGRYAVKAVGDSMLPRINPGDIVICDVNMHIDNGNIVNYTLNGESGIKKLITDENNKPIMLMPLNDKYPPIPIKESDNLRMAKCFKVISSL
jgi:repressor LexA